MVCIKHSNHQNSHPCILLAYRITSHLSMHHSPCIVQNMQHFCDLNFASCHATCIYCIIRMHPTHASCMLHLTHNHLCIVSGFPRPFTHLRDFTPTALHIMRSKSHCITYQAIPIPLHIMASQPHCIAYHCISHPRVFTPSHHEIFISVHISTSPSIASLHSSNPTNTSSLSMIHLGLPRPLQVFLTFRASTLAPGFLFF